MTHEERLLDLLAIIHGDGGRFTYQHGVDASIAEAQKRYYSLAHRIELLERMLREIGNYTAPCDDTAWSEYDYGFDSGKESWDEYITQRLGAQFLRKGGTNDVPQSGGDEVSPQHETSVPEDQI